MSTNCLRTSAILFCVLLCASSAFGLTAKERAIAVRLKTHLDEAQKQFDERTKEVILADQRASDAEKHAADTEELAKKLQGDIDKAHANEQRLANEVAKMKPVYDQVNRWWGIGGIIYGFKRLAVHLLILTAVLIVIGILVVIFVPAAKPIAGIVGRFGSGLLSQIGKVFRGLIDRFKPRPHPPP